MVKQLLNEMVALWNTGADWEEARKGWPEAALGWDRRTHSTQQRQSAHRADDATLRLSAHAWLRIHQRGLSPEDVALVLRYGRRFFAADAEIYFLGDRDLPCAEERNAGRLRGVGVILSQAQPNVITVWRNRRHGMRTIRRKLAAGPPLRSGSSA
ncbi:MAG: hypothetical protein IPM07_23835 [Anaerolineales bacterium]|nr:hypothetical protein [Anaerolineales bacterium]